MKNQGRMHCPICQGTGKITEDTSQYEFTTRDPITSRCLVCDGSGWMAPQKRLPNGKKCYEIARENELGTEVEMDTEKTRKKTEKETEKIADFTEPVSGLGEFVKRFNAAPSLGKMVSDMAQDRLMDDLNSEMGVSVMIVKIEGSMANIMPTLMSLMERL